MYNYCVGWPLVNFFKALVKGKLIAVESGWAEYSKSMKPSIRTAISGRQGRLIVDLTLFSSNHAGGFIITSSVSGRGNRIDPVCVSVCLCVCLSVSQRSHGQTNWCTHLKNGTGIGIDELSDKFDGQGHRSRSLGWNIFWCKTLAFYILAYDVTSWCRVTSQNDVMTSGGITEWRDDIK